MGGFGTLMRTEDGGFTWRYSYTEPNADLRAVTCTSRGKCLVAGGSADDASVILSTANGGVLLALTVPTAPHTPWV